MAQPAGTAAAWSAWPLGEAAVASREVRESRGGQFLKSPAPPLAPDPAAPPASAAGGGGPAVKSSSFTSATAALSPDWPVLRSQPALQLMR